MGAVYHVCWSIYRAFCLMWWGQGACDDPPDQFSQVTKPRLGVKFFSLFPFFATKWGGNMQNICKLRESGDKALFWPADLVRSTHSLVKIYTTQHKPFFKLTSSLVWLVLSKGVKYFQLTHSWMQSISIDSARIPIIKKWQNQVWAIQTCTSNWTGILISWNWNPNQFEIKNLYLQFSKLNIWLWFDVFQICIVIN